VNGCEVGHNLDTHADQVAVQACVSLQHEEIASALFVDRLPLALRVDAECLRLQHGRVAASLECEGEVGGAP